MKCVCEQINCEHCYTNDKDMRCRCVMNDNDEPYYVKSFYQDLVKPLFSDYRMKFVRHTLESFERNCPYYKKIQLISKLENI